jgi:hypothetical protein
LAVPSDPPSSFPPQQPPPESMAPHFLAGSCWFLFYESWVMELRLIMPVIGFVQTKTAANFLTSRGAKWFQRLPDFEFHTFFFAFPF